jgi:hypothetical protein
VFATVPLSSAMHKFKIAGCAQSMGMGQQRELDSKTMAATRSAGFENAPTIGGAHPCPEARGLLALAGGAFQGSFHESLISSVSDCIWRMAMLPTLLRKNTEGCRGGYYLQMFLCWDARICQGSQDYQKIKDGRSARC